MEWDQARAYLKSEEGEQEVEGGLVLLNHNGGPALSTPALWTALFHRAPVDIIQKVYKILPEGMEDTDLHLSLECDCRRGDESVPDIRSDLPRREWHPTEHLAVVVFLAERVSNPKNFVTGATACPAPTSKKGTQAGYTPLAHAIKNPKIGTEIVKYLCFSEPSAIDTPCQGIHDPRDNQGSLTLLPISLTKGQVAKRDLLLLGSGFYLKHRSASWEKVTIPPVSVTCFESAIHAAADRKDWNLLRDLIPAAIDAGCNEGEFRNIQEQMEKRDKENQKRREEEEWRRKKFGFFLYHVDIIKDLYAPLVPRRSRGASERDGQGNMARTTRRTEEDDAASGSENQANLM